MVNQTLNNTLKRLHLEVGLSYQLGSNLHEQNHCQVQDVLADWLSRESLLRPAVNLACRHWIDTGSWPLMDDKTRIWVSDRLAEAYLTIGFLSQQGFTVLTKTENELLDFLLVEWWEKMVLRRTRGRIIPISNNSNRLNRPLLECQHYPID